MSISPASVEPLRWRDHGLLALFVLVLVAVPVCDGRLLTTHEAVHCQNVREMLADGDWLIPHYGGRVWLERPPLPHWITATVVALSGQPQSEWPYRLASALAGLACVLMTGWIASLWYGRGLGLLSGAILATMHEFLQYLSGPECDIFLCLVVTTAMTLFVRSVFVTADDTRLRFLGVRPWSVLAFFVVLGLSNTAKGLFFGMLFILIPVVSFLLRRRGEALRRHLWLWGWGAFLLSAVAWPLVAYVRHPDVVDLWLSDYMGRVNQGYMREPIWYYLVQLPMNLLPWSLAGVVGAVVVGRQLRQDRGGPESFLLCWAILPIIAFSIPQGKHHHYLLHNMTPWAILAAVGTQRLWNWMQGWPHWLRSPWAAGVLLGGVADGVLVVCWERLPGIEIVGSVALVALPLVFGFAWWSLTNANPRRAALGGLAVLVLLTSARRLYQTTFQDNYRPDRTLLARVSAEVPADAPLVVVNDLHPLDASWVLFYLPQRAQLVHNLTLLPSERIHGSTVYVVARRFDEAQLTRYGSVERVSESELTRGRRKDDTRWTLYRVQFHDGLPRVPANISISPMQATGRAPGPTLPLPEPTQANHSSTHH